MPTLDWLHRAAAFSVADKGPSRLRETVSRHGESNEHGTDNLLIHGFGLPTSRGRFDADFVAELVDGRGALLKYKGARLLNDPYEIEKSQMGALWPQTGGGRAVFGGLIRQQRGQGLQQQIDVVLA